MALTTCYECGKEISDQASKCSHCGAPKRKAIGHSEAQQAGGVIVGILTFCAGLAAITYSLTKKAPVYVNAELASRYSSAIQNVIFLGVILCIIGLWATFYYGWSKTKKSTRSKAR